ncbi:MAG: hypothetical protein NXI22_13070 [bacterium]|nr:hypothetical protein [bacterium]
MNSPSLARRGAVIGSHNVRTTPSTVEGEGVVALKEMTLKKYNDNSALPAEANSGDNANVDFQVMPSGTTFGSNRIGFERSLASTITTAAESRRRI